VVAMCKVFSAVYCVYHNQGFFLKSQKTQFEPCTISIATTTNESITHNPNSNEVKRNR